MLCAIKAMLCRVIVKLSSSLACVHARMGIWAVRANTIAEIVSTVQPIPTIYSHANIQGRTLVLPMTTSTSIKLFLPSCGSAGFSACFIFLDLFASGNTIKHIKLYVKGRMLFTWRTHT